jgi:hypothetical protein
MFLLERQPLGVITFSLTCTSSRPSRLFTPQEKYLDRDDKEECVTFIGSAVTMITKRVLKANKYVSKNPETLNTEDKYWFSKRSADFSALAL